MNKIMCLFFTAVLGVTSAYAQHNSHAGVSASRSGDWETISVGGSFNIGDAETQTVSLGNARYIKNLVVQAEGVQGDSTVEVMVNGEVKGTIYAPGADPSYVVTVEDVSASIQFRHRTGGGMRIFDIKATVSEWRGNTSSQGRYRGSRSIAEGIAYRALRSIETIRTYANLGDDNTFLMPIKKKAGSVIVMANGRGDLATKTSEALVALRDQIDFSKDYLNLLMEEEGLFDTAVDLLALREEIDDLLN